MKHNINVINLNG